MRAEVRIVLTACCDHCLNLASLDANVLELHGGRVNTLHDRLRAMLGGLDVCNAARLREGGASQLPSWFGYAEGFLKKSHFFEQSQLSSLGGQEYILVLLVATE